MYFCYNTITTLIYICFSESRFAASLLLAVCVGSLYWVLSVSKSIAQIHYLPLIHRKQIERERLVYALKFCFLRRGPRRTPLFFEVAAKAAET